jgi:gelsolin
LLLSYFTNFQTIKGGVESGFKKVGPKEYKPRFFHVQSVNKTLSVTQVEPDVGNMNDGDVYILDKGLFIYQMNMAKSAGGERNKAAAFAREIASDRGGCKVIVHGKLLVFT